MISIQHVCKTYDVPKKGPRRTRRAVLDAAAPASAQSASPVPAAAAATAATAEAIAAASGPDGTVRALDDICLEIADGDIFGIIGMSGAGKSTLVRTINLLERPTSGSIVVDGVDVTGLTGAQLREYRRRVAMIFQNFGLLAQKTVLDNVCFPFLAAAGKVTDADRERALSLLERVGLREKASSYPSQLSGGQQQRVAIARALACDPEVILCDEATSALDPKSTNTILKLLRDINRETGVTLVVITHSMDVVEKICRNVAVLEAGRVVEQGSVEQVFADPRADATRVLLGKVEWDA
ncbi:MAG TPA: ATP-binding cassette domain-containing protein [Candidatus Collinsella stercoripullorum]|nr:ATP-binding cassette domain-containing protein [Candidatus Collinsella stercoripullorum]HJA00588.1 ATP-binding cassette domain-containing protein [Candidatus Collinsella stercoripullorum]